MAGFPKAQRQAIIDGYLNETGRNIFSASEFLDWLSDRPDHPSYDLVYGQDQETAAREHRLGIIRKMISGLRIVSQVSETRRSVVHITTREYPAYVSPVGGRKSGGGYEPFNPEDAAAMAELRRQGASALRGWLARYRGAFEAAGVNLASVEEIAASQDDRVAQSA